MDGGSLLPSHVVTHSGGHFFDLKYKVLIPSYYILFSYQSTLYRSSLFLLLVSSFAYLVMY